MAALRLFARCDRTPIARLLRATCAHDDACLPALQQISKRWSSYNIKDAVKDSSEYTDFEITKNPDEWKYVTRLLRPEIIAQAPSTTERLPSGWKPRVCHPHDHPYFIERTRNHMIPVYLECLNRGERKITVVRKIQGDIWLLHKELEAFIQNETSKIPGIRINELSGVLKFRGDYVMLIKKWLEDKGF